MGLFVPSARSDDHASSTPESTSGLSTSSSRRSNAARFSAASRLPLVHARQPLACAARSSAAKLGPVGELHFDAQRRDRRPRGFDCLPSSGKIRWDSPSLLVSISAFARCCCLQVRPHFFRVVCPFGPRCVAGRRESTQSFYQRLKPCSMRRFQCGCFSAVLCSAAWFSIPACNSSRDGPFIDGQAPGRRASPVSRYADIAIVRSCTTGPRRLYPLPVATTSASEGTQKIAPVPALASSRRYAVAPSPADRIVNVGKRHWVGCDFVILASSLRCLRVSRPAHHRMAEAPAMTGFAVPAHRLQMLWLSLLSGLILVGLFDEIPAISQSTLRCPSLTGSNSVPRWSCTRPLFRIARVRKCHQRSLGPYHRAGSSLTRSLRFRKSVSLAP